MEYTATVISVGAESMDVLYEAPGKEPIVAGVRRALVGESLQSVLDAHAPLGTWEWQEFQKAAKQPIMVGYKLVRKPDPAPEAPAAPRTIVGKRNTLEIVEL